MISLTALGLPEEAERTYLYVLRHGPVGSDTLEAELGLPVHSVEEAMTTLISLRLIRVHKAALEAIEPAVAIERLIEERVDRLNSELRDAVALRGLIPQLAQLQQRESTPTAYPDIEQLTSPSDIRARLEDLAFFVRSDVLSMQPDGALPPTAMEAARPLDLRALRRGVTMRAIILSRAMDDVHTSAYVRELATQGAQYRTVEVPMEPLVVFDRSVAVVPVNPSASRAGALIVRQAGLVTNMVELFERVWNSARPIETPGGARVEDTDSLSVLERQVLTVLCRVDKDEIGAREMNMSVRTFRRYVADVMLRLGAANRFQAALLAKERGWL